MNKILLLVVVILLVLIFGLMIFLKFEIVKNPSDWTDTSWQISFGS